MKCPRDKQQLKDDSKNVHHCSECQGYFLERGDVKSGFYKTLESSFKKSPHQPLLACPGCTNFMMEIHHGSLHIDVCSKCKGIWLDADEGKQLDHYVRRRFQRPQIGVTSKINSQQSKVQQLFRRYQQQGEFIRDPSTMEALFQIFTSLPLERNLEPVKTPILTLSLVLLNIVVFLLSISQDYPLFLKTWAYIPDKRSFFPYTLFSSFIHGGWWHLIGNLYFLWVLGDNVEDLMGKVWAISLYLVSGMVGFLASGIVGPANIPHIGASCSVAGIMAAYFMLFPKAKFVLRFFIFIVFPVSCYVYLGFWFAVQLISLFVLKSAGVSWAGHVFGFITGAVITAIYKVKYNLRQDS